VSARYWPVLVTSLLMLWSFSSNLNVIHAYADSLRNALPQRIGNYNVELKTDPVTPLAGQSTKILLKISSVNGDDLVDLPIIINISKDGVNQEVTHPIYVPYGHSTHEFTFKDPGTYALDVTILDDVYTGQNITVTFPVNVVDPLVGYFSSSFASLPFIATVSSIAIAIGVILFYGNKKKRTRNIEDTRTTHKHKRS